MPHGTRDMELIRAHFNAHTQKRGVRATRVAPEVEELLYHATVQLIWDAVVRARARRGGPPRAADVVVFLDAQLNHATDPCTP